MQLDKLIKRSRAVAGQLADYLNPQYLNAGSTAKTSLGFMGTMVERWLPDRYRQTTLESIFNFLPISARLLTSGQPTELQFAAIKSAGITQVINLAPHGLENSLDNEAEIVAAHGMRYTHIPVDFKNPTEQDFETFCQAMQAAGNDKVLVHCAANMRVSAFMYRYRTQVLGEAKEIVAQDLAKIWEPFGVWAGFVGRGAAT